MTTKNSPLERYVPLVALGLVLLTLLVIPLKILSYGFLPVGDARRHIAKAFTEKPDSEVIVLRPGYALDHNPGWEWVLRHVQKATGWNLESMAFFAVLVLLLAFFLAAVPWLRRPEAWLAALLAQLIFLPSLMVRLVQIRPLLVPEAILIALLFVWSKKDLGKPSWLKLILTAAAFGFSTWIDGAWFLWGFLFAAFFMARAWPRLFWLVACWLVGTAIALILIGHPFQFMAQTFIQALTVASEHVPSWVLVGEMTPSQGEFETLTLLTLVFLWRRQQGQTASGLLDTPVFWMIIICWMLGLRADRCWADWGIPAVLVWLTLQFQGAFTSVLSATSPKRLLVCGGIAFALFFQSTNDFDRRYSQTAGTQFVDAQDPTLQGWLPGKNGIFYSSEMAFYYDTFYKNPHADWRYILGYEPAIMPEEDLKILRAIQLSHGAFSAYEPWIKKMQPADRLVIYSGNQPGLPDLEWHRAVGTLWIGRLPATATP